MSQDFQWCHDELKKRGWDPDSECSLIALIDQGSYFFGIWAATILLRDIGTAACIPALKKALYYPKTDIQITSLWTISMIAGAAERDLYLAMLLDTNYSHKMTAIFCVAEYCGEEAVDAVSNRVKKLLPAKRSRIAWNREQTELTRAVSFIVRFPSRPKVESALQHVIQRWSLLETVEKEHLRKLDFFANVTS